MNLNTAFNSSSLSIVHILPVLNLSLPNLLLPNLSLTNLLLPKLPLANLPLANLPLPSTIFPMTQSLPRNFCVLRCGATIAVLKTRFDGQERH